MWPNTTVQTCVVHLIRNSIRFCSWKDRKAVTRALKPIYRATTIEAAALALDDFETEWGGQYRAIVDLWRRNWERFCPFLAFDAAIRKIIYTTNAIESLNYQLRKVTKTRGHFPTEDAVLKILYLAIRNIENNRGGELGTGNPRMETSTQRVRHHLPRTPRPDNMNHNLTQKTRQAPPIWSELNLMPPSSHRSWIQSACCHMPGVVTTGSGSLFPERSCRVHWPVTPAAFRILSIVRSDGIGANRSRSSSETIVNAPTFATGSSLRL